MGTTFDVSSSTLGISGLGTAKASRAATPATAQRKRMVEIAIFPGALARSDIAMDSTEVGRLAAGSAVEVLEVRPMPDGRTRLRVPFGEGSGWISDATAKGEPIVRKLSDETERDGDELRPASVGSAVDVLQGALMQDDRARTPLASPKTAPSPV